jgi:hypothetical protein
MTGRRMDWRRARLHGRPSLDHRHENDTPDRAARWLRAVEHRQRERPSYAYATSNSTVAASTGWITASSTAGVPW